MSLNPQNLKVIARKNRPAPNDGSKGYIIPVLYYDEDENKYKIVKDSTIFPNEGEVFIIKGYNYIDNTFNHNTLFELTDIFINDVSYDSERKGSCLYTATSNVLRTLDSWEYIQIFDVDFDIANKKSYNINISDGFVPFFIRKGDNVFGPFNYDVFTLSAADRQYFEGDLQEFDDKFEAALNENEESIFKFQLSEISDLIEGNYIENLRDLFNTKSFEEIYFGSKEKLIEWGKRKFSSKFSEEQKNLLTELVDIELPDLKSKIEKEKINLFSEILRESNTWLNIELPHYFNNFLSGEDGKGYLDKYLEDNKESLFSKYRQSEIQGIDQQIEIRKIQLQEIEEIISEKAAESKEEKTFENISQEETEILKKIIHNETTRKLLLEYYKETKNIEEIKHEYSRQKGVNDHLTSIISKQEKDLENIKNAMQNVKNEFFKDSDFAKKVIDAKLYTDLINNIDPSSDFNIQNETINEFAKIEFNNTFSSAKPFLEELVNRLKHSGRKVSYNDLINYLVLINQNFITVFAGLPGVGKTSLIEHLSKVLGIYNNRFLKVSVSRGWTSSKDLLGYFNPLTKKYQSSKTGLLNFLKDAEREINMDVNRIALLDEANLSPIEHYWSDFMTIADDDYRKIISITDDKQINFGNNLRFIATVNYDHTTEVLSDRLISRAPIVKLHPTDYIYDNEIQNNDPIVDTFSASQINGFLTKGTKDYFKGDVKNKFESIIKALQEEDLGLGQAIIIGHRKYNAVEKYCNVAGNLMDDQNKFVALDYAVNQYILSLINGRGEPYLKRLISLQEKLQGMPQSLKHLAKIISSGTDNYKNYKFFC